MSPGAGGMARNDTLTRTLHTLRTLEVHTRGLSVKEIRDKLEADFRIDVSEKTVRRDLDALTDAGFPLAKEPDARYKLEPIATITPNIQLTYNELFALFLARQAFESYRGSPLFTHLRCFFDKVERALKVKNREEIESFHQHIGIKPEPGWAGGVSLEIMDTVHNACVEGHMLRIEYKSNSSAKTSVREVGPEAIYFADAGAYLVAEDQGLTKLFALGRVKSAEMLETPFESHGGFNVREFLRDGIGVLNIGDVRDVRLMIREPIASYVSERRWHESQSLTRTPEGVELRLKVRVNSELARWVLGLGPHAKVLEPAELRDEVLSLAQQIIDAQARRAG